MKVKDHRTIPLKRYEQPSEDKPLIKKGSIFLLFGLIMLVPASLLAVAPAQGTVQGAASVFVAGPDGVTKNMELKATKSTAGVELIEDFQLAIDNVVSTPLNGKITVFADVGLEFTGAKLTPAANPQNTIDIPIVGGQISFEGMYSGVYTLDVIIGNNAYECIVVVGQTPAQFITNIITEINTHTSSSTVVKVFEKGKVKKVLDKEEICRFTPQHPACAPDPETGECPDGFNMNEDGQCFTDGPCPDGYHRANDDETGACISEEDLNECDDGSWAHPGDFCYGEEPPVECPEGTVPDPESPERCIEPPADFKACPDMVDNPDCKLVDEEPTECGEGFVLENGKCAALDSNCGGEPCTASDKENSTTSDVVPAVEPEPEEPQDEEEEQQDETEESEEEESEDSDQGSDRSQDE